MFEEVKEMIDSTIYENGKGEITAQNINLAMQGIVDATEEKIAEVEEMVAEIGENGTGGSGPLRVWMNEENTPEQIAVNVETYNALMQDASKSAILMYTDGTTTQSYNPVATITVNEPTPMVQFGVITGMIGGEVAFASCFLFADGSVTIE